MEIDAILSVLLVLVMLGAAAVLAWRDIVVPRRERKARREKRRARRHPEQ